MSLPQTITLAQVKAKAREFYEKQMLTAQHPDPRKRQCVNDGKNGYRCAVAAAFSDTLLETYPKGSIQMAVEEGRVIISPTNSIKSERSKLLTTAGPRPQKMLRSGPPMILLQIVIAQTVLKNVS